MPIDLIEDLHLAPGEVRVRAERSFAEAYLRDDFWVRYEIDGVSPTIPEERALIPFLSNVAPVIWLAGIDVEVPVLDERFLEALADVRAAYAAMYPSLEWRGSIAARSVAPPSAEPAIGSGSTVFFSGGVDSVFTSLHVEGDQVLLTVRGADIPLDNDPGWQAARDQTSAFARAKGHRTAFAETNFRHFLDTPRIEARWPTGHNWWADVQHGPGLIGLAAPLVSNRVHIAATLIEQWDQPYGSTPALDGSMAWSGAEVVHHGYDTARRAKVASIVRSGPVRLRVCFKSSYGLADNCGRCDKCLRTVIAIVGELGDPRDFGFRSDPAESLRLLRRRMRPLALPLAEFEAYKWDDVRTATGWARLRDELSDPSDLDWFLGFDLDAHERRWARLLSVRTRLVRMMRRVPALERSLKRARSAVHRSRG